MKSAPVKIIAALLQSPMHCHSVACGTAKWMTQSATQHFSAAQMMLSFAFTINQATWLNRTSTLAISTVVDCYCPDWHLRLHYLLVRSFASVITAHAASGCELVDGSVVIIAPMNGSAVKISEPIHDHAVIRERAIRRALERMNYGLGPLTAANRT